MGSVPQLGPGAQIGSTAGSHPVVLVNYRPTNTSDTFSQLDRILGVTDTSAVRTITLSPSSMFTAGTLLVIKDESNGASKNIISILPTNPDTIDGLSSVSISADGGALLMYVKASGGFATIPGAIGSSTPPVTQTPVPLPPQPDVN